MPSMSYIENNDEYSVWVGLIYVFNLMVGTGALTLPAAFSKAGWALGLVFILFLAFMSFLNVTYVIECISCGNAILKWKERQIFKRGSVQQGDEDSNDSSNEHTPIHRTAHRDNEELLVYSPSNISRYYCLDRKMELGEMANLFFNRKGRLMFYIVFIVYLYGDLSIYSAAVAKSVMDIVCTNVPVNYVTANLTDDMPCFKSTHSENSITRLGCYRAALLTFILVLGPFTFFNVQKTKYLQLITTIMRWLAFVIMIWFAVHSLIVNGPQGNPPVVNVAGMPALFGAGVYSFMCHHSLPGLVTPIRQKKRLGCYLILDYILISIFYLLLAFTGAFAFAKLDDLYTLNFIPTSEIRDIFLKIIDYFLTLFPVFTLSTSFLIIAITLRNNIQSLFLDMSQLHSYNFFLRRLFFPIVAIVPPILLTMFLEDITVLVGFTGSYAGSGIQYLIPTFLVLAARKHCSSILGFGIINQYQSPFKGLFWAVFVIMWSVVCVILVSIHFFDRNDS